MASSQASLKEIKEELKALREDVISIKKQLEVNGLEALLKRRGLSPLSFDPEEGLMVPSQGAFLAEEEFYQLLKKYSFRIFLREVIKRRDGFREEDLTQYSGPKTIKTYLNFLKKASLLRESSDGAMGLVPPGVRSFGDTLEWLIAQIFRREFSSPSAWGVKLGDRECGGDYDVMAIVEGNLLYCEVKSSPPKHIEQHEISSFIRRIKGLRPHGAFFFEDTQLRMKDKIVPMFEEELKDFYGQKAKKCLPIKRLQREIYTINNKVFILNSKPSIESNIGLCLKHFLQENSF